MSISATPSVTRILPVERVEDWRLAWEPPETPSESRRGRKPRRRPNDPAGSAERRPRETIVRDYVTLSTRSRP
jgi:hypothetical protein